MKFLHNFHHYTLIKIKKSQRFKILQTKKYIQSSKLFSLEEILHIALYQNSKTSNN